MSVLWDRINLSEQVLTSSTLGGKYWTLKLRFLIMDEYLMGFGYLPSETYLQNLQSQAAINGELKLKCGSQIDMCCKFWNCFENLEMENSNFYTTFFHRLCCQLQQIYMGNITYEILLCYIKGKNNSCLHMIICGPSKRYITSSFRESRSENIAIIQLV